MSVISFSLPAGQERAPLRNEPTSVAELMDLRSDSPHRFLNWLLVPMGVVVLVLRLMGLLIYTLLSYLIPASQKKASFRIFLRLMGIQLKYNLSPDEIEAHTAGHVVAGNHVSVFDFLPGIVPPLATPLFDKGVGGIGNWVCNGLMRMSGTQPWRIADMRSLAGHFSTWKKSPESHAIYVTPEATIGNGSALFRFRHDFLCRKVPVVPLALKICTPFGLSPHPVPASGGLRFLRLLMMPCLCFETTFLPARKWEPGTDKEAFAQLIQEDIAQSLGIVASPWTVEDKRAYLAELEAGSPKCYSTSFSTQFNRHVSPQNPCDLRL